MLGVWRLALRPAAAASMPADRPASMPQAGWQIWMAVPPDAGPEAAFQTLFRDEHQVFVVELETLRKAPPLGEAFCKHRPFLWVAVLFFVCYTLFSVFHAHAAKKQRAGVV